LARRTDADLIASDVYGKLRARILAVEIKPGARLVEEDLCEMLQAGRTPVREALLRLQGEGLVTRDRGWIVQSIDPGAFRTIFESRMAIEGFATRLAAERATDADLADLKAILDAMANGDSMARSEVNRLNQNFHKRIVALSGNPFFVETHERTQFQYWNLRMPVIFGREQLQDSDRQHRAILEALVRRDPDSAEKLTRDHIAATMSIVAEALE
jgi:DNA-binding GntR family transcriptional regulator